MKYLLILAFISISIFAIDDATIPNTFVPLTPATAADVNENFDSLETAQNRTADSLNTRFVRYSDFDSTDTNFNKMFIDTIRAIDGRFATCSTGVSTITTANIEGGTASFSECTTTTKLVSSDAVISTVSIEDGTANLSACTTSLLISNNAAIDTLHNTDSAFFSKCYIDTITVNDQFNVTFASLSVDSIAATGGITAATLNTGQGDNELYDMDQNVLTTSSVTYDSLHTTSGATFSGNVGVGEASPLTALHITKSSPTVILEADSDSLCVINFGDNLDVSRGSIVYDNSTEDMIFKVNNLTEKLRLKSGGDFFTSELSSGVIPSSGYGNWFCKTDGLPYFKNDAGSLYSLSVPIDSGTVPCTLSSYSATFSGSKDTVGTLSYYKIGSSVSILLSGFNLVITPTTVNGGAEILNFPSSIAYSASPDIWTTVPLHIGTSASTNSSLLFNVIASGRHLIGVNINDADPTVRGASTSYFIR